LIPFSPEPFVLSSAVQTHKSINVLNYNYTALSNLLLLNLSSVQIFSSAPISNTFSLCSSQNVGVQLRVFEIGTEEKLSNRRLERAA
jgi:hypothetical protein